jgi:hypothetical protein
MFLLLISLFTLGFILAYLFGNEQSYGINKTVGWAYDISHQAILIGLIFTFCQILFIFGYLTLYLVGRQTKYFLSIAHFELIILTLVLMSFENFIINIIVCGLSIMLFFINIYKSHK